MRLWGVPYGSLCSHNRFLYEMGMCSILKPEDMSRMANYRFAVRMMTDGWLSGHHQARRRGSSSDFLEYRAYSPGDDPRLIDWRAYARTDRMQLRMFGHETHLGCHLFVDCSASMGYRASGSITKLEYAAHFAACMAWLVIRGNDPVSLQLFDEELRHSLPLRATGEHLNACLNALETIKPGRRTDLPAALEHLSHLLVRPGALIIISDFFCDIGSLQMALSPYLHRGSKIALVQVLDRGELDLRGQGMVRFSDLETAEHIVCNIEELRGDYAAAMKEQQQRLHALAVSRGMLYFSVLTDQSFYPLFDALAT